MSDMGKAVHAEFTKAKAAGQMHSLTKTVRTRWPGCCCSLRRALRRGHPLPQPSRHLTQSLSLQRPSLLLGPQTLCLGCTLWGLAGSPENLPGTRSGHLSQS